MRVAVTVEQSWHLVPGGIAASTVELLRALVERGDVELVGVAARHREPPPPDLVPPVPVRHFPLSRRLLYETWQWARRPLIERATGAVDVVHDMGYVVPPSTAPLVATIHDLLFKRYPEHYPWHTRIVLERGFALARRHARLVVCPSEATMRDCRAAGIGPERLRVIPWGVRPVDVDPGSSRAHARYGLARPYVLFVGTVEPRKNLRRLIAAFDRLGRRDLELVLVGPRGWKEEPADPSVTARAGVRWLGSVPRADLPPLFAGARVVVYPSLAEGFGLPVLEAMAAGAPVVTSLGTSMAEVADGAALLVDPLSVEAISDGVERILDDRQLAEDLRSRARARAAAFTWERSAALVASVYAEAAR